MQLQQRALHLFCRFLSSRCTFRRSSDVPLGGSKWRFSDPLSPQKPNIPVVHASKLCSWSTCSDPSARFGSSVGGRRGFCGGAPAEDYGKEVDEINLRFAEAREEIDAALESKDTVYFNEEAKCAREAVKVVLDMFEGLLRRLPEKERAALQRSMGLKMEQLKAEFEQLNE